MSILSSVANDSTRLMESMHQRESTNLGFASVMYERLMEQIADFEADLDPDEEIGGYLASFGRETLIAIEDVGFHNPYLLFFTAGILRKENGLNLYSM